MNHHQQGAYASNSLADDAAGPDARVAYYGNICILYADGVAAQVWVEENLSAGVMRYLGGIVIESRYVDEVVTGMREDGLTVVGME